MRTRRFLVRPVPLAVILSACLPSVGFAQEPDPDAVAAIRKAYELAQEAEKKLPDDEGGYQAALHKFNVAEALCADQPGMLAELLRLRAGLHSTFGYVDEALADLQQINLNAASSRTRSFAELLRCKLLARQGKLDGLKDSLQKLAGTEAAEEAANLIRELPDIAKSWELAQQARQALTAGQPERAKIFAEASALKWPENALALALGAVFAADEPGWSKASTKARLVNRDLPEVLLVLRVGYQHGAGTKVGECLKSASSHPAPLKESLMLDLGDGIAMELVKIPAGEFVMGAKHGAYDEKPAHGVTISRPFYLGRTEVTQLQWDAVMGSDPSHFRGCPDLPVRSVSWSEAQTFLRKLSARVGRSLRLPTEAEWEYACRGGTTTSYSFGDDKGQLGKHAWFGDNSDGRAHPVGQKEPNPWGLYDMHGNVEEWCSDWYGWDYYGSSPPRDPRGPASGEYRVLRGGSWFVRDYAMRSESRDQGSESRDANNVYYVYGLIGFRVASGTE